MGVCLAKNTHGDSTPTTGTELGTSHTASEGSCSGPKPRELPETELSSWRPATAKKANEVLTDARRQDDYWPLGDARVTDDATDVWIYSTRETKDHEPVDHAVSWHYKQRRSNPALIAWEAKGSSVGPMVCYTVTGARPDDHFHEEHNDHVYNELDHSVDGELDDELVTTSSSSSSGIWVAEHSTVPHVLPQPTICNRPCTNVTQGAISGATGTRVRRCATVEDADSDV